MGCGGVWWDNGAVVDGSDRRGVIGDRVCDNNHLTLFTVMTEEGITHQRQNRALVCVCEFPWKRTNLMWTFRMKDRVF